MGGWVRPLYVNEGGAYGGQATPSIRVESGELVADELTKRNV